MLGKLFKHEIKSYLRVWIPVQIVLLGVALLNRFIQFFEADNTAYGIIFGSSVFVYVVAILAAMFITWIICITRFYKNLFTGEGYLTFTLPVTSAQHILTKMTVAVLFQAATAVMALVSVAVISAGEMFIEIVKAAAYIFDLGMDTLGAHLPLYILEVIVLYLVASCSGMLLIYGCIALGQTFNKSRVGWAVGIYFIYYMICQILGTVFTTVITIFYDNLPLDNIMTWIDTNPYASIHIALTVSVLFYAVGAVIYYAVTHFVIKRKLNLE